jgi:hypothetical protein
VIGNGFFSGNVGIGTTAPSAPLQVVGNTYISGNVGIQNTAPAAPLEVGTSFSMRLVTNPGVQAFRATNYAPMISMDQGFGESAYLISNDNWSSSSVEYYFGTQQASNTFRPGVDNQKSLGSAFFRWTTVFASNGLINTSDAREKHDVRELEYGIADVMKLRPVVFKWNNDPKGVDKIGFIAQEVKTVINEVVKSGEDFAPQFIKNEKGETIANPNYSDRLGIYYSDLIPVVVKGMQDQQKVIEEQKAKIDALEARLKALENK